MIRSPETGARASRFSSIFAKCMAMMVVSTLVVATVISLGSMRLLDRLAVDEVNQKAEAVAENAVAALAKPLRFQVAQKISEETEKALVAAKQHGRAAVVLDPEGNPVAQAGGAVADLQALAHSAVQSGEPATAEGGRLIAVPVLAAPEGPVLGVFAMAWRYDAARAAVFKRSLIIFALALATFLGMIAFMRVMLRRVLGEPLVALESAVERITAGDYQTQDRLHEREDEAGSIARNLVDLRQVLVAGRQAELQREQDHKEQQVVVAELARALDRLADGVLVHQITTAFPPQYEALRTNYNRAVSRLREAVLEVTEGASTLQKSADQIAGASDELAQRTETQAATLEQSAAALEQMLNSVHSAAQNAETANKTAQETQEIAEHNSTVMSQAVTAMDEITQSSEKIREITSVIDDIAFQTNLLALNAGVEAARAGESGKGFAVVASEVRGLAKRCAEAAQQIKVLIEGSGEKVQRGVSLVETAGQSLQEVLRKIGDVTGRVEGIARAAGEQAAGLNEINSGFANLDQVTQQNAAMVEEATAASHEMRDESVSLTGVVQKFTVERAAGARDEGLGHRAA